MRRFARPAAALISVAAFLLLPFALTISRSLQPEALMVTAELAAFLAIYRYNEAPTRARFAAAALASAAAVFVKIPAAFFVLPVFVGLEIATHGIRGAARDRRMYLFLLVTVLPGALWTAIVPNPGTDFLDRTWLSTGYVVGWLTQINVVVGLGAAGAGAVATALYARGLGRPLLFSLWVGYGLYGLFFDYAIATHSYYSVNLIPIVAIGLGLIVEGASARVRRFLVAAVFANAVGLLLVAALFGHEPFQTGPGDTRSVSRYQAIGKAVGHSTSAIVLADGYGSGRAIEYFGLIAAQDWPARVDLVTPALQHTAALSAETRLSRMQAGHSYHWFIAANLEELVSQPDLLGLLRSRYPVVARGDGFVIYDLSRVVPPP